MKEFFPPSKPRTPIFGARRYAQAHPGARILIGCSGRGEQGYVDSATHGAQRCADRMRPRDTISSAIQAAVAEGGPALVGYLTAGFPSRRQFKDNLVGRSPVPATSVEIGVPFSDPMADGTTIQRASFVALADGVTLLGYCRNSRR